MRDTAARRPRRRHEEILSLHGPSKQGDYQNLWSKTPIRQRSPAPQFRHPNHIPFSQRYVPKCCGKGLIFRGRNRKIETRPAHKQGTDRRLGVKHGARRQEGGRTGEVEEDGCGDFPPAWWRNRPGGRNEGTHTSGVVLFLWNLTSFTIVQVSLQRYARAHSKFESIRRTDDQAPRSSRAPPQPILR